MKLRHTYLVQRYSSFIMHQIFMPEFDIIHSASLHLPIPSLGLWHRPVVLHEWQTRSFSAGCAAACSAADNC